MFSLLLTHTRPTGDKQKSWRLCWSVLGPLQTSCVFVCLFLFYLFIYLFICLFVCFSMRVFLGLLTVLWDSFPSTVGFKYSLVASMFGGYHGDACSFFEGN